MSLIEKLTAALGETERIANAALSHPGEWSRAGGWIRTGTDDGRWHTGEFGDQSRIDGIGITIYDEGGHDEDQARHIAHNDPAHVLRQVAAHRRILEIHSGSHECTSAEDSCVWIDGIAGVNCETVEVLAEAYGIEVE